MGEKIWNAWRSFSSRLHDEFNKSVFGILIASLDRTRYVYYFTMFRVCKTKTENTSHTHNKVHMIRIKKKMLSGPRPVVSESVQNEWGGGGTRNIKRSRPADLVLYKSLCTDNNHTIRLRRTIVQLVLEFYACTWKKSNRIIAVWT